LRNENLGCIAATAGKMGSADDTCRHQSHGQNQNAEGEQADGSKCRPMSFLTWSEIACAGSSTSFEINWKSPLKMASSHEAPLAPAAGDPLGVRLKIFADPLKAQATRARPVIQSETRQECTFKNEHTFIGPPFT
jgi:hypothetical protein